MALLKRKRCISEGILNLVYGLASYMEVIMIKWSNEMAVDNTIAKKLDKTRQALEKESFRLGVYCIALASNEKNLFDIVCSNELLFKHYKKNTIYIVGLACSRESAVLVLAELVEKILKERQDLKIREYFTF